jgi:hypothetical protein
VTVVEPVSGIEVEVVDPPRVLPVEGEMLLLLGETEAEADVLDDEVEVRVGELVDPLRVPEVEVVLPLTETGPETELLEYRLELVLVVEVMGAECVCVIAVPFSVHTVVYVV